MLLHYITLLNSLFCLKLPFLAVVSRQAEIKHNKNVFIYVISFISLLLSKNVFGNKNSCSFELIQLTDLKTQIKL